MAQPDMPLEELKVYMGSTPKPEDWEQYWQTALEALNRWPVQYTLEEDEGFRVPGVVCSHLWFTGLGGARIHAQLMKPTAFPGKRPAVLLFHGYEGHSHDYFEKLPFAQSGIVVAAMDTRGQAGLSEDNLQTYGSTFQGHIVRGIREKDPQKLFFRNVFLDTVLLARIVSSLDFVDSGKLASVGFSQGGALSIACSALSGLMNRTVAGYPFLSDFKRVVELGWSNRSYDELTSYFKLEDPRHLREDWFYNKLGYIDVRFLAEKLTAPVLFYTGYGDRICPPSCQYSVYNRIKAPKTHGIYPEYGHELLPGSWQEILLWLLNM